MAKLRLPPSLLISWPDDACDSRLTSKTRQLALTLLALPCLALRPHPPDFTDSYQLGPTHPFTQRPVRDALRHTLLSANTAGKSAPSSEVGFNNRGGRKIPSTTTVASPLQVTQQPSASSPSPVDNTCTVRASRIHSDARARTSRAVRCSSVHTTARTRTSRSVRRAVRPPSI